jgi:hypothetical protein
MKLLRLLFPFLLTLFLWRLSLPFWNPAGILALIPVFYYTFIKPTGWFAPFGAMICFLIDYFGGTVLFWTFAYLLAYAADGFQNTFDLTRDANGGLFIFMGFFGVCVLILSAMNFSILNLAVGVWLVFWSAVLYVPITLIAKGVAHD